MQSDEVRELFPQAPQMQPGLKLFALLSASGTPILVTNSRDAALANAWAHDLQTVSFTKQLRLPLLLLLRHDAFDRRDQAVEVLRPREPVIAVLDERQRDAVPRQMLDQLEGVPPGHVRVLHSLQDVDRAAGADRRAEQQMPAAVLDQAARDRVGLGGIERRAQEHALGLDRARGRPSGTRPTSAVR